MAVKFLVDLLSGNLVMVNVAVASGPGVGVDNLLLEDGSNILLEDGSVLLLE